MLSERRGLPVVYGCVFLAVAGNATASDDARSENGRSSTTPIPYRSIFDNSATSGVTEAASQGKIHRMLARQFTRLAEDEALKAWVLFRDKGIPTHWAYEEAVKTVAATYNRRAIERRLRRRSRPGLFDEYDLPVVEAYLTKVQATGARIHIASKWINGVSVQATELQLRQIERLPFVKIIQPVRRGKRIEPHGADTPAGESEPSATLGTDRGGAFYGQSLEQLTQINLVAVHDLGYTGASVVVGILDTGFQRSHEAFNDPTHPVRVLAEWDFVDNDSYTGYEEGDPGGQHSHGTLILGTLGAYNPGTLVGGAYNASFILCKTEDVTSESTAEEDNYVAGLEFIEENGGDMATASLTYLGFDNPGDSYTQEDLDGLTAISTIGVNVATANGIHCCNAASNRGHDGDPTTSTLGAPADALEMITVGAVDNTGTIASFSSDGPSADGRVKPEVLARGINTRTVSAYVDDEYTGANGTSLSAPLAAGAVACLIDAYPNWTVQKMREALFETGDYYLANGNFDPAYVLGYGVIDTLGALRADCNENDINDLIDISGGTSQDCNGNDIPDECERDCNQTGIPDGCDIAAGDSNDCDGNGIPDECDPDCDDDGIPNVCESLAADKDCDFNGICNGDEIDNCIPGILACRDCNANFIPDGCDLAAGRSSDINDDRIPDECLGPLQQVDPPHDVRKSRYISIDTTAEGVLSVAIAVELGSMRRCSGDLALTCEADGDCPMGDGPCTEHPSVGSLLGWVAEPWDASCVDEDGTPNGEPCTGEYLARLDDSPTYRVWTEDTLHIGDCAVSPVATYHVEATMDGILFSDPLAVGTIRKPGARHFGDVVGEGTGDLLPLPGFTPAQGVVNITDIQAVQLTIQGPSSPSAHFTWVDTHGLGEGSVPNLLVNVSDVQRVLFGFAGSAYSHIPEQLNPADCP